VCRLAEGSFGEVRRVLDTALERTVAMKILHAEIATLDAVIARFEKEVKLTAGLAHPGIVAVHDWGTLADGRLWYTMREVRGRTFGEAIEAWHRAPDDDTRSGWTFRRLVDAFARACQAVAYAHRRGIVHRDLKPDNIMVGELGDVLVMDWGLARRVAEDHEPASAPPSQQDEGPAQLTHHGDILGTPAYMPPEQALGLRDLHGPRSDVYALGAILYHLLAGRPPYGGALRAVLAQVVQGSPPSIPDVIAPRRVPEELVALCQRAMARTLDARPPDAGVLADEVVAWLDGARRREQALGVVVQARALEPEIAALRARAAAARAEAARLLDGIRPFEPIERKRPGWALEDEAGRLTVQAALREAEWMERMQGTLTIDPELPEAHTALADHHRDRLVAAERAHRDADAVRAEAALRVHDRGQHAALLRGDGALTLVTDPPGAAVHLERYELRDRRLVPEDLGLLGTTPLRAVPLPRGSYRLRLRAPGCAEVLYPVLIERGGHWDGCPPGESEPAPVRLPREGEIGEDERYVPAGWCWTGGERGVVEPLPHRRIWVDAFVMRRFPVTNQEYLDFLDDLVAQRREHEALAACPKPQTSMPQGADELLFGRDGAGRFQLRAVPGDCGGRIWQPDWPVVLVSWPDADAFARWLSERTRKAFRLPDEIEREKAARGVDGRRYPWGNDFDATWARVLGSQQGDATRVGVGTYPEDESPYGLRGLAGNVRDWCANPWTPAGPPLEAGARAAPRRAGPDAEMIAVRGGCWISPGEMSVAEARFMSQPGARWRTTGVRVVRDG
jgi:serine/threonine-protein kinase